MPTVHVPGVGDVERKYVWYGLGTAGLIAIWYWWRQRTSSASTSSTTDPNAIDPLTGLPYSAEQSGNTGYVNPNPVTAIDTTTGNGITTNQAWVADVIDKLGNIGQDPAFVGAVLGKYLASQPLTLEEAAVVRMAWAFSGKPPQGPNNFTLATGGSTPGTTPTGVGGSGAPAIQPAPATWHPPATQRYGNRGDLVKQIQAALKGYGFDPGPLDGIFGPKTLAAVKAFQRSRGLSQDGIVGPQTWLKLHG